jgi:hypothetical protein
MRIHKTNDPHSEYKLYDYQEILSLNFKQETLVDKMAIHERWSFSFTLNTSKRMFTLYSPSQDERTLWIHTFFWIVQRNLVKRHKNEDDSIVVNNQS